SPRFPFSHALAWEKVPIAGKLAQPAHAWLRGRMRARAKRGSCRLHHRRARRAGPLPALRATFSRASARAKGKCEANLARMGVRGGGRPSSVASRRLHEMFECRSHKKEGNTEERTHAR